MYELTGDKACQACAAGYYSTGGTSSCQAYGGSCDNGQMQDQQNLRTRENQCKSCDAMYELTGDKACQAIGFDVGVEVRVKASVVTPRYHWGTVTHSSIGEVITIADNYIVVKFPEFPSWKADPSEMELVNEAPQTQADKQCDNWREDGLASHLTLDACIQVCQPNAACAACSIGDSLNDFREMPTCSTVTSRATYGNPSLWMKSTQAQQFVVGSSGTMDVLGEPLTVAECQTAASRLGKTFNGEENEGDYPPGCYIYDERAVYFNQHPTGKAESQSARVFKQQAPSPSMLSPSPNTLAPSPSR